MWRPCLRKGPIPMCLTGAAVPVHWCVEGVAISYEVDGLFPCSFTLHEAVSLTILATLLSNGASPDVADRQGCTALHSACDVEWAAAATLAKWSADEFE